MYSGKTTVARQLAQYLADHHGVEVDVIDTDEALENRYHLTVADCFRRYGEPMFRTLETTAMDLPRPIIKEVEQAPTEEEIKQAEDDFNKANLQRFQRVEFWMQKNRNVWTDNTFGRDQLCREVGINRQLLLQSVRSQGYNNVHDYINSYRINDLKRRIQRGQATTLTECLDSGFGTVKTVRSCFLKSEGTSVDAYLQTYTGEKGS